MSRPVTATIHTDAMRHNLASIRARTPSSRVMAMVKADAYGHGLETAASALREADAFGVASIEEARRIRALGLAQPILVLSGFASPADLDQRRELDAERDRKSTRLHYSNPCASRMPSSARQINTQH